MKQASEDVEQSRAPVQEAFQKHQERMDKVLTASQRTKLKDWRLTALIKQVAAPVELTEQQMKAVKWVVADDASMAQYFAIRQSIEDVMTPAQKAVVRKGHAMMTLKFSFGAANLTAEQMKQAKAACDQLVIPIQVFSLHDFLPCGISVEILSASSLSPAETSGPNIC